MNKFKLLFILIIFIQLAACKPDDSALADSKFSATDAEIIQLKNENESINAKLDKMENDLSELRVNQFSTDWAIFKRYKKAVLVPGSNTYQVLQTDIGAITVSLQDVQPYANGSQISLIFMNGTGYNYMDTKINFRWGKYKNEGIIDEEKSKSRIINIDPPIIYAGRYSTIIVRLDGFPPSELDYVELSDFEWKSITLK